MADSFHNHVHLDSAERSKLFCRLDESPERRSGRDRRRWKRWDYQRSDIAVIVQHPGGGTGRFLVCARNISAGGISFIHGGYVHPGSDCRVVLPRRDGTPLAVAGVVAHCRHVESSHHEVGLQFLQEVDPTVVLPISTLRESELEDESLELPALDGRVLVVDQSPADRRLLAHQLAATGLNLMMVDTTGAALDAVRRRSYEIVLCDLNLEDDAVRMIKQIREVGFRGPILVVTAENDAGRLIQAREVGANEIIGKPFNPAYLASLIGEWLEAAPVDRPIYSTIEDMPGMVELIADFVEEAQRAAHKIAESVADAELGTAREVVLRLMGSGTGYGFGPLTEAARDALTAMDTTRDKAEIEPPMRRLISICLRLRCGTSVRPIRNQWKQAGAFD